MSKKGMLFIQGCDRPGIIRTVTGILYECGANLEDVSMTLLEGQFAMMVSFNGNQDAWKKIARKIPMLRKKPLAMHTDLTPIKNVAGKNKQNKKSVLISAIGKDRTGIVHRLSSDLAQMKANITNLDCRLLGGNKSQRFYSMMLEVDFPGSVSQKRIDGMILVWEKDLGVEVKTHSSETAIF